MAKGKLRYKLAVPTAVIIVLLLALNFAWSYSSQREQAQEAMREQASMLTRQLNATWDFMAINQDRINYDSDGTYDFKGLHCSIVGLSVSGRFSQGTDYKIRYVSDRPRNAAHATDAFETAAMERFRSDAALGEYDEMTDFQGQGALRYTTPLRIDESCIDCHGGPAGERDITGYAKEGLAVGDLYGVISVVIPSATYDDAISQNVLRESLLFLTLIVACVAAIYFLGNRLVKQLEQMNERLAEESRYKSDFLAVMSHELRTPLTSVIAFTEILQADERATAGEAGSASEAVGAGAKGEDGASAAGSASGAANAGASAASVERTKILGEIRQNAAVLLSRINNILDVARLEAGKSELALQLVDVADVINSVEAALDPLARAKGIALDVRVSRDVPLIMADPDKARRIVENLVSNAVKFTPEGGHIAVRADFDRATSSIRIVVADDGIGITAEELSHIFDKFTQGDASASRRYNGSGLGLSLAKELIELHGGTITVESEPGRGSQFTAVFPLGSADEKGEA